MVTTCYAGEHRVTENRKNGTQCLRVSNNPAAAGEWVVEKRTQRDVRKSTGLDPTFRP